MRKGNTAETRSSQSSVYFFSVLAHRSSFSTKDLARQVRQ